METRNKKTLEQFQQETHDQFAKVNDMFQQLMNEFQTIKHERYDNASSSRGKLILSGDKAKPYLKLQFPHFSGGDPTSWLYQASQLFEFQSVALEKQVDVASMHLDSIALQWHRCTISGVIREVVSSVDGLPEEFLMACYIGGLKDEVRLEVKMKKPRSLIDAMGLARMAKEKLGLARKQSQPVLFSTPSSVGRLTPTDSAGILGSGLTTTLALPSPPTRRILNTYAKARREKGLCYYCDEKYLPGHQCTKPQFFMIQDVGEDEKTPPAIESAAANYSEPQAEVSFHAITCTIHPQTLRLPGKIKNKDVAVLIDGGTTHYFIDQALVNRFGLIIDLEITLEVIVGNREKGLKATELQAVPDHELVALQGLAYLLQIEPCVVTEPTGHVPCLAIQELLHQYDRVFQDPQGLPPIRSQDHQIPLLPNARLILATNRLYAKITKCCFRVSKVNYLGHVISSSGVAVDQSKVQAVLDWPTPRNAKGVRGCLGLAAYYRKFIKHFCTMAAPLHKLVGKTPFIWHSVTEKAFQHLKQSLTTTPTLGLPDWSKSFTVECDASGVGIGAILTQQGHPIAYYSAPLKGAMLAWSIYEKEMLAIVKAVKKWRSYLLGQPFVLMGYGFRVEYKKGVTNRGSDALSRQLEFSFLAVSHVTAGWWAELQHEVKRDTYYHNLLGCFPTKVSSHLVQRYGVWFRGDVILLSPTSPLISKVLQHCHASPEGGHFGFHKTLARVKESFWWSGIKEGVKRFIQGCHICQRFKTESCRPAGLLQPLPIPSRIWEDISMDFIEGLPPSNGFTTIMLVVDRLSKYAHFVLIRHPFTTTTISKEFVSHVVKLHGIPSTIVRTSKVQAVEEFLLNRDKLLRDLRSNLLLARDRMKSKADSKRREVAFSVGDMVYLKLQPYRQSTVAVRLSAKDPPIPVSSEVSPAVLPTGPQPEAVLEERVVKKGKYRPKAEVLVKWKGFPREDATWETKWRFQKAYPDFHLEDKAHSSGGD
nr:transposon Ty3-G Gag-Pol polyprotein [Tanacetum cinerariifolium]